MTQPLLGWGLTPQALTNVTPFTYRDNATYIQLMQDVRDKVNEVISVVNLNAGSESSDVAAINAAYTALVAQWNAILPNLDAAAVTTLVNNLTASLSGATAAANAATAVATTATESANAASAAATLATNSLTTFQAGLTASITSQITTAVAGEATIARANETAESTLARANETAESTLARANEAAITAATKAGYVPAIIITGAGIDPTGTTDSTTAIQTLITANPGRKLVFPPGVYTFTQLKLDKGQHLAGSGWQDWRDRTTWFGSASWLVNANYNGTVLRSTLTVGVAINILDTEVGTNAVSDFILIGPGIGLSIGVQMGGTSVTGTVVNPVWRNIKVANFATGVFMQWVNEGSFYDLTVHGCTNGITFGTTVNNNAFYMLDLMHNANALTASASSVANTFYSPLSQVNNVGFVLNGYKNIITNLYAEGHTAWAIDIAGGNGNIVIGPLLSSATDGVRIQNGVYDTTVLGFGMDGGVAPLVNAGTKSYLQGDFTGVLTDTGVNTILVDSGSTGAAWASFVSTMGGTGWAIGNGSIAANAVVTNKTVHMEIVVTFGTTSTFGSEAPTFTLPYSSRIIGGNASATIIRNGVGYFQLAPYHSSNTQVTVWAVNNGNGAFAPLTNAYPAAFAAGDVLKLYSTYERA